MSMSKLTRGKASPVAGPSEITRPTQPVRMPYVEVTSWRTLPTLCLSSSSSSDQLDQSQTKTKVVVGSDEELSDSFSMTTRRSQQTASTSCSEISELDLKEEINSTQEYLGLPSYKCMSGFALNDLFKRKEKLKNALIIDSREKNSYRAQHLRNSYNIPTPQVFETESFANKNDVMKFFVGQLPTHVVTINRPGHYGYIILYDNNSTDPTGPAPLCMMLAAICRWNAGTKTEVWFLEGGFQTITSNFPHLLDSTNEEVPFTSSLNSPPLIEEFVRRFYMRSWRLSIEAAEILDCLEPYMKHLNESIDKTTAKLEYQRKLRVLKGINFVLKEEELTALKILLGNLVDNGLKCQACKEVFSGIIYQCADGHCICSNCSEKRLICCVEECGISFKLCGSSNDGKTGQGKKIRNTILEKMMAKHLEITCPNGNGCGKTLKLNQVSGHAAECVKVRGQIGKWLEVEIGAVKEGLKVVNQELKALEGGMKDLKWTWLDIMDDDKIPMVCREFMEELYAKSSCLHELQMTLHFETFVKRGVEIVGARAN